MSIYKIMNEIDDELSLSEEYEVTCLNKLKDGQICNSSQSINKENVVCYRCGANLISQYARSVVDPDSPYKLIFNKNIVSKSKSPNTGKGANIVYVTKGFFDNIPATIHKNTKVGSNYGAFDIEKLSEPLKSIIEELRAEAGIKQAVKKQDKVKVGDEHPEQIKFDF